MNLNNLTDTQLLDIVFNPKTEDAQAALSVLYRRQMAKQGITPQCDHASCGATNAVLYLQQLADPQQMINIAMGGYADVAGEEAFKIEDIKLNDDDPFKESFKK